MDISLSGSKKNHQNTLRIIAGEWRGRKLVFPDHDGLRPTTDRIRETVFSWLQSRLSGARVLDLFAGSGALGLEAASRGAAEVVMIDNHAAAIEAITEHCSLLGASQIQARQMDALQYVEECESPFDVVFVDPPFDADLQQTLLPQLLQPKMLKANAMVYIEAPKRAELSLPTDVEWYRHKIAGDVQFGLIAYNDNV